MSPSAQYDSATGIVLLINGTSVCWGQSLVWWAISLLGPNCAQRLFGRLGTIRILGGDEYRRERKNTGI
jgi:hypothetical protein